MGKELGSIVQSDVENVWHHLTVHTGKPPMIITKAKGLHITDINGKEYLDATSGGVWCVNVGYGREEIAEVVCEQMKTMSYYAPSAGNLPTIEFSEKLLSYMPGLSRVYLSNSGSEANEKAYKMVRLRASLSDKPGKNKILYRDRDYHGTTIANLSACGQPERKHHFGPFVEGFVEVPHASCYRCVFGQQYPGCNLECADAIEKIILKEGPETVGAGIFEPITAGGGVIPPVKEYYQKVKEIFAKYDILLIMDEVVCGIGRTGTMFGYEHYDIIPDMVTLAKGVASAYMPVSCTVTTDDVFKVLQANKSKLDYFRDISTYGGCAAGAKAAIENLNIIEREKLLENVRTLGSYLLDGLKEIEKNHSNAGQARGVGFLAGLEMVVDKQSKKPLPEEKVAAICAHMASNGVIVGRTNRSLPNQNNVITLAPGYIATKKDIDLILSTLQDSMRTIL